MKKNLTWNIIKRKILELKENDQYLRNNEIYSIKLDIYDTQCTTYLEVIIILFGFPKKSLIGKDGMFAFWLLIQHAYKAIPFQKKCLLQMQSLLDQKEVSKLNIAYLTDRIKVLEGKPQLYGTQYRLILGEIHILPVDNVLQVHKRRKKLNLENISQFKFLTKS